MSVFSVLILFSAKWYFEQSADPSLAADSAMFKKKLATLDPDHQ